MPYEGIDGRTLTDYRPSCEVIQQYMRKNGITNGQQLRMYLQRNAEKIIQNERRVSQLRNQIPCNCGTGNCYHLSNK